MKVPSSAPVHRLIAMALALAACTPGPAQWRPLGPAVVLRSTRELIERLRGHDPAVRAEAAQVLGTRRDGPVRDALVLTLRDRDATVRQAAERALLRLGDASVAAELVALLEDPAEEVRLSALRLLKTFRSAEALSRLIALAGSAEPRVAAAATAALVTLGDGAATHLVTMLEDPAPGPRATARRALAALGVPGARAVLEAVLSRSGGRDVLLEVLGSLGPEVAAAWLDQLRRTSVPDGDETCSLVVRAGPALRAWARRPGVGEAVARAAGELLDEDRPRGEDRHGHHHGEEHEGEAREARQACALATLSRLGVAAADVLVRLACDEDAPGEDTARETLEALKGEAGPALLRYAESPGNPEKRRLKALELASSATERGGDATPLVPVLGRLLQDPIKAIREAALEGLENAALPAAIPVLLGCIKAYATKGTKESAEDMVEGCFTALGKIKHAATVPALLPLLRDRDAALRAKAASALGDTGRKEGVPALRAALRDPEAEVRRQAAMSLGQLDATEAAGDVQALLTDRDPQVRRDACAALGQLKHGPSTSHVTGLTRDPDVQVRRAAFIALGRIGGPAVRPTLLQGLGDADLTTASNAAWALGWTKDVAAIPALVAAGLRPGRAPVAQAVIRSLGMLGAPAGTAGIARLLGHPEPAVRLPAVEQLARLKDPATVAALRRIQKDPDARVAAAVARALEAITGVKASTCTGPGCVGEKVCDDLLLAVRCLGGKAPVAAAAELKRTLADLIARTTSLRGKPVVRAICAAARRTLETRWRPQPWARACLVR